MLFNSFQFILFFLPITLVGFFVLCKRDQKTFALIWLVAASLFFYGWWNPIYLWLIIGSLLFNYTLGKALRITSKTHTSRATSLTRKTLTIFGITCNLGALAYYKYASFVLLNVNFVFETDYNFEKIILHF